jgi:hypothetical protein
VDETTTIFAAFDGKAFSTAQVKELVMDDGRECFEITTDPSNRSPFNANVSTQTVNETRMVIDKKTFLIVETQLLSQTGSTISRSEYRDIEHPTDLRDELFIPPNGIEFFEPQGTQEYVTMVTDILKQQPEKLATRQKAGGIRRKSSSTRSDRRAHSAIEPDAAPPASRLPPATIREEFEHNIAARMADGRAAKAHGPSASTDKTARSGWFIAILSAALVALALGLLARRRLVSPDATTRRSRPRMRIQPTHRAVLRKGGKFLEHKT